MTKFNNDYRNFLYELTTAGKKGESIFEKYCYNSYSAESYERVDELETQRRGIDYIVTLRSGDTVSVEVKFDVKSLITGNFFIEFSQYDNRKQKIIEGWLGKTEADYLFLIYGDGSRACFVRPIDLRELVFNQTFRVATCKGVFEATGYLVPADDLPGSWVII